MRSRVVRIVLPVWIVLAAAAPSSAAEGVSLAPPDNTPPVITAVGSAPAATSTVITWTTNEPSTSRVDLGPTTAYGTVSSDPSLVASHSVSVSGLTCGTLYHYRVQSTDGSGNTASSSDLTLTTVSCAPISDDFRSGPLDSARWTFVNPLGDASVSVTGGSAVLALPAGLSHDVWTGGNQSARILQRIANSDFTVEVKFGQPVATGAQLQGLLVEQDAGNFVRFDVYHNGTSPRLFAASFVSGSPTVRLDAPLAAAAGSPFWLRVTRSGNTWTERWSVDGTTFTIGVTFTHTLTVSRFGPFAGNFRSSPPAPAFTCAIDYVFNTASPIVPEDGDGSPPAITGISTAPSTGAATVTWATNELATSQVEFGTTTAYGSSASSPGFVTAHSVGVGPLTCGTLYHYRIGSLDAAQNLALSADGTFTTGACPDTTPPQINAIGATPSATSAAISWATNEAATSAIDVGLTTAYGATASDPALVLSHSLTAGGLTCNRLYHYRVRSSDGTGNAAASADATFTTSSCPSDTTPPQINAVGATPSATSAAISWATNEAATSAIDVGLTTAYGATVSDPALVLSHSLTAGGLTCNRLYHYRVRSSDGTGNAAASPDATFQTSACPSDNTPPQISAVGASASSSDATVSWTTDEPSTSRVDYGATTAYGAFATSPGFVSSHVVPLAGLSCGTLHHYRVSSADAAGNAAASADGVFTTSACPSGAPVSDDFHAPTLDTSRWTFVNPLGDAAVSVNGTNALIALPAGASHDVWTGGNMSARLLQTTANVDFTVEVKFESAVTTGAQLQGLLVQQDASNFVRFDLFHDGTSPRLFAASFASGAPTIRHNAPLPGVGAPFWLRVRRTGNVWTEMWSSDGLSFTTAVSFTHALNATRLGPFAGNFRSSPPAPAFTASIDYVFNTASPIVPEDGPPDSIPPVLSQIASAAGATSATVTWTTDEASTSRVDYGITTAYGSFATSPGLTTGHTVLLPGLACETLYHYRVRSADAIGNTAESADGELTTGTCPDMTPPQITEVQAGATVDSVSVTWTTNEPATSRVELGVTTSYGTPVQNPALVTDHSLSVPGLDCNTLYHVRVLSADAAGNSAASADATVTTGACPPDLTPPVITSVAASPTASSATITWTTDEPATSRVDYGAGTSYGSSASDAVRVRSHSLVVGGLSCGALYHFQVTSTDGSGNTASSPDATVRALACAPGAPVSDDFHGGALNTSLWSFVNPLGDASASVNGTNLLLALPSGASHDVWTGGNQTARLVQTIANVDFTVEVKFDSAVTTGAQLQGLIVEQDAANFVRFDLFHDGTSPRLFAASFASGSPTIRYNTAIPGMGAPFWLRVTRSGNTWTERWSTDGVSFQTAVTFTHALTTARLGPFAGNFRSPPPAPAFTASVDYVFNTASPIVPEDGPDTTAPHIGGVFATVLGSTATISWETDEPATSRIDYGPTTDYGAAASASEFVNDHFLRLTGLPCDTVIHYRVQSVDRAGNETSTPDGTFATCESLDTSPPVLDGLAPEVSFSTATIRWTTDEPATGVVEYGPSSAYGALAPVPFASFTRTVIDPRVIENGHKAKVIADFAADGFPGVAVQAAGEGMNIFRPPAWTKFTISSFDLGGGTEDARIADVDGDGDVDIVVGGYSKTVAWFENPLSSGQDPYASLWSTHIVENEFQSHDVETADFDEDGRVDVVTESGIWFQNASGPWTLVGEPLVDRNDTVDGRGTAVADLLGDGHLDVLAPDDQNRLVWLENPIHTGGSPRTQPWTAHVIAPGFVRTTMRIVDLNGDGRKDVVAASMQAEATGGLAWYEAPEDPRTGTWVPHMIDATTRWIHQGAIHVADLNLDGKLDLILAEQEQSDQDRIGVYYGNRDDGSSFTLQVLARTGMHNPKLAPVAGDVLPSLLGANHGKFGQANPVELWRTAQPEFLTGHEIALSGLACGAVYHYRVVSLDRSLNAVRSPDGTFETEPCPPDSTPPGLAAISTTASRTAAVVTWTTDEPATSEIEYGATTSYGATGGASGPGTSHALDLCGLACGTTYHYRVASTDHAGNRAVSSDRTFQTAACASAGGPSSDDFHAPALNTAVWTVVNPVGDGAVSVDGTHLSLSLPAGVSHDVWSGGNRSIRVMQPAANGSFTLEAKFDSLVRFRSQMQGFLVEQDAGNYIRFDVFHDGATPRFFSASFVGGSPTVRQNAALPFTGSALWLRVTRSGTSWTASWSQDGSSYTIGAAFTQALTVAKVGLFAANHASPASQSPAFTASVDYFLSSTDPILYEDGAPEVQNLTVDVVGEGVVAKAPERAAYVCGETVQLTATPQGGWEFAGWSGALTGAANPRILTMTGDQSVGAHFVRIDRDGDGIGDELDDCPDNPDPSQDDADGDGAGDACDPCPDDLVDDPDADGVCSGARFNPPASGADDNCPDTSNPDQADDDDDGAGDVCDICPDDLVDDPDADGVCSGARFNPPASGADDNCPDTSNPDQANDDGDGAGDVCDPCPDDLVDDPDADGVCSGARFNPPASGADDNCPAASNPDQADDDDDGAGDACDTNLSRVAPRGRFEP